MSATDITQNERCIMEDAMEFEKPMCRKLEDEEKFFDRVLLVTTPGRQLSPELAYFLVCFLRVLRVCPSPQFIICVSESCKGLGEELRKSSDASLSLL
jgi:hypothetical protein